eukprot:TRINITY_DN6201_c0_g1_i3.p1 TRINITY_DN6201_c0_g1~~TRINITY_DN6201_c0_g1_i3.p1  ORF type:complete len:369 (-),score=34.58 TRINITY_DN6201_c0_g1_i3:124-1230(-)
MILLQFASKWNRTRLDKFKKEISKENVSLDNCFTHLSEDVRRIVKLLLEGAEIQKVAYEHESRFRGRKGISTEDFRLNRKITTTTGEQIQEDVISKLASYMETISARAAERIEIKLRRNLPQKKVFCYNIKDLSGNLERISEDIPNILESESPKHILCEWQDFKFNMDAKLLKFSGIFRDVSYFGGIELNMRSTNLSDEGCSHILHMLQRFKELPSLSIFISNTNVSNTGFSKIVSLLSQIKLHELYLRVTNTRITDDAIDSLAEALVGSSLEILNLGLGGTSITDDAAVYLIDSISKIPFLSSLTLDLSSNNAISNETAFKLAETLKMRTTILNVVIDLQETRIKEDAFDQIFDASSPYHINFEVNS